MKKVIILGFFVSMVFLSYSSIKFVVYLFSDDMEIEYVQKENHLTYLEEEKRNIQHKSDHHVHEFIDLRYTYIKKNFGWDMKIDTLGTYTLYEEN